VPDPQSKIVFSSARLYIALHPILTNPGHSSAGGVLDAAWSRLAAVVAKSALTIIEHVVRQNKSNMVIAISQTSNQILEAGVVWAYCLLLQKLSKLSITHTLPARGTRGQLSPVIQVSRLLTSFAARWKPGSVYVDAWNTVLELIWHLV
jgi:hypothetical protein